MFDQIIASLGKTRQGFTLSISAKRNDATSVRIYDRTVTEVHVQTDNGFHVGIQFTARDSIDKIKFLARAIETYHPSK